MHRVTTVLQNLPLKQTKIEDGQQDRVPDTEKDSSGVEHCASSYVEK